MPDRRKIKTERNGGDEDDCDIMALFTSISRRSHSVLTRKKKKKKKAIIWKGETVHWGPGLISIKDRG